jgi:hypothetical protein
MLEGRLADADADAAAAEGLRVAGADPGYAAPLYALGFRAAADRAELARARRDDEGALEARRAGAALAGELRARLSPEGADGTVPTPRTEAQAVLCQAELARLDGRADPQLWEAAAKAWGAARRALPDRLRPLAPGRGAAAGRPRPRAGRGAHLPRLPPSQGRRTGRTWAACMAWVWSSPSSTRTSQPRASSSACPRMTGSAKLTCRPPQRSS